MEGGGILSAQTFLIFSISPSNFVTFSEIYLEKKNWCGRSVFIKFYLIIVNKIFEWYIFLIKNSYLSYSLFMLLPHFSVPLLVLIAFW